MKLEPSLAARLSWSMARAKMNQSDLARAAGVTQGAIQQIVSGRTAKSRFLPEIANALDVTPSFLSGLTDDPQGNYFEDVPKSPDDMAEELGLYRIREIDVGYAMGAGTYLDQEFDTDWRYFDREMVQRATRAPASRLFIASGVGDSMGPTILDADTLIIDTTQTMLNQQDRLWAIAYGGLGMVKRIRRLPSGNILVISDNPTIENFEADPEDIRIVGRVALLIRRT